MPRTRWTESIAGGRQTSWGMSLNKMVVSWPLRMPRPPQRSLHTASNGGLRLTRNRCPWRSPAAAQIFNMTEYRKIVFMDSDTLVFKNIDHLFGPEYPMFTGEPV